MNGLDELEQCMHTTLGRDITLQDVEFVCRTVELYAEFLDALLRDIDREEKRVETVRLLDFDMIYASLWRAIPPKSSGYQRLFGVPQSTYHFFRYNKRRFSLPLGTEMEMARWIVLLGKQARVQTSQLQKSLNALTCHGHGPDSPEAEQCLETKEGHTKKQIEEFHRAFERSAAGVIQATHDLEHLSAIRDSDHRIDTRKLIDRDELDDEYYLRLDALWRWLQSVRRDRAESNWADACNLAYYALTRKRPFGQYHTILASGTQVVIEAPIEGYLDLRVWPSIFQPGEPPVIKSRFLTFATAFEQYCGESKTQRQRTYATVAREALALVLAAQRDFWVHGMKPDWLTAQRNCKHVPWSEFAGNSHFKRWAWEYLRWRGRHLADVLAVFEHYGTTDDQLRNSYLQIASGFLDQAIKHRTKFLNTVRSEDYVSEFVSQVRRVSQEMVIRLSDERAERLLSGREESWRQHFAVEDCSASDRVRWIVRLLSPVEPLPPLVAEIKQLTGNDWEFLWPVCLDVAQIVRFGPSLMSAVCQQRPTTMTIYVSSGSKQVRVDDLPAIRKAMAASPLDFEIQFEVKGTVISFIGDSSSFPDAQGIDMFVRWTSPDPSTLAEFHRLTALCAAPRAHLAAMFKEALSWRSVHESGRPEEKG